MLPTLPPARQAKVFHVKHPQTQVTIDQALVLYFCAPHSFTGEDCLEFHLHGSLAVLQALFSVLDTLPNVRLAAPGEFTRRAFENNKLDLTQAEALADLIAAETESQRQQALSNLQGTFGETIKALRTDLVSIMARVEALVDFPDEDIPKSVEDELEDKLQNLRRSIHTLLKTAEQGMAIRDGFRIAILGEPNVGKSSLLNALANKDAAIVTAQAGTTRDIIEVHANLAGYPVILVDTAGLRETEDVIEAEGIKRARKAANTAHLKLWLDAPGQQAAPNVSRETFDLYVLNKCDLIGTISEPASENIDYDLRVSAKTGQGLDDLKEALAFHVKHRLGQTEQGGVTRERHRLALQRALEHLPRDISSRLDMPELVGEDLRQAARALGEIIGTVDVEDILDDVFASFCIGK